MADFNSGTIRSGARRQRFIKAQTGTFATGPQQQISMTFEGLQAALGLGQGVREYLLAVWAVITVVVGGTEERVTVTPWQILNVLRNCSLTYRDGGRYCSGITSADCLLEAAYNGKIPQTTLLGFLLRSAVPQNSGGAFRIVVPFILAPWSSAGNSAPDWKDGAQPVELFGQAASFSASLDSLGCPATSTYTCTLIGDVVEINRPFVSSRYELTADEFAAEPCNLTGDGRLANLLAYKNISGMTAQAVQTVYDSIRKLTPEIQIDGVVKQSGVVGADLYDGRLLIDDPVFMLYAGVQDPLTPLAFVLRDQRDAQSVLELPAVQKGVQIRGVNAGVSVGTHGELDGPTRVVSLRAHHLRSADVQASMTAQGVSGGLSHSTGKSITSKQPAFSLAGTSLAIKTK
jgi:hypothetical protein